jgi:type IV pilus assembly protein PilZ
VFEKRSHPRIPLGLPVTCRRADGTSFSGTAKDVSIGGMFVESSEEVAFGDQLTITLRLPLAKQDLVLPAIVRWLAPGGFGVQFGLLGARETHALSQLFGAQRTRP